MCNLLDDLVALGCILHLCYESTRDVKDMGYGANRFPQPRMELAERSQEHTFLGRDT